MSQLRRLWPKSLDGQILLAAALALALAQAINFALLLRGIEEQNLTQASAFAGSRVIFTAGLDDRDNFLGAEPRRFRGDRRRRGGRGAILQSDAPPSPAGARQAWLEQRFLSAATVNNVSFRSARILLIERKVLPGALQRRPRRLGTLRGSMRPDEAEPTRALIVSAELPSGQWISAASSVQSRGGPVIGWLIGQTLILYLAVLLPLAFIAHRMTRPLRKLTGRANAFTASGDDPPLREEGPDDLRNLIAAFNAMEARVTTLIGEKDVMLGAIGHDLKTPLAALRVRIESVEDDSERARMADSIDEMVGILDDILVLARLGRSGEESRRTDLAALVETVVEEFADRGGEVQLLEPEQSVIAQLRPVLMRRALRNLVGNALKYGHHAKVAALRDGQTVCVRIQDDGPGIDPAMMEQMFEPFVRADASRNRATGGSGLGLTIARAIARAHGGDVTLENRPGGGLSVVISLPG